MYYIKQLLKWIVAIIIIIFVTALCAGLWYIVGYFISNEPNPLNWWISGKIIYLLLVTSSIPQAFNIVE